MDSANELNQANTLPNGNNTHNTSRDNHSYSQQFLSDSQGDGKPRHKGEIRMKKFTGKVVALEDTSHNFRTGTLAGHVRFDEDASFEGFPANLKMITDMHDAEDGADRRRRDQAARK